MPYIAIPGNTRYYRLRVTISPSQQARKRLILAPKDPRFAAAQARELATVPVDNIRDGTRAVELASQLLRHRSNDPVVQELLAAALAETRQTPDALHVKQRNNQSE